ncbi:autotransporter-associated beta strand repeat-containing protein, partial [Sandarakinorhabdus limnophila]|uniref:autotransporter-associated beta strand repeat-containing protein n=1 Tax=Sandarakinorhabdus limnophila TaxID=210512 RepID=UPI0026ECB701
MLLGAASGLAMSAAHANDILSSSGINTTIATTANSRTITQTGARAVINWTSLDVASGHTLTFVQPNASSIVLNRVIGSPVVGSANVIARSQIDGTISANGQVWILNPKGIVVGSTGSINVSGFLATTLGLTDEAFAIGNAFSLSGESTDAIVNGGTITTASGYVVLAGNRVTNSGLIQAEMGTIALGSGQAFSVSFSNDKLISFAIPTSAVDGGLSQASTGQLLANGGRILMTARAAADTAATVINVEGLVQAQTVSMVNGQIVLDAGMAGVTDIRGTLDASGGTTISAGTLQIGNGGTSGSITGNITNSGALVFNRSDSLVYSGSISGSGSLNKSGAGTLTLTGANTYTGDTTISAGSLIIGTAGTAGAGALSIASGSVFEYASSANQTISGAITGAGSLSKSGAGTLTLSGANTYSGGTTISSGTLTISSDSNLGTGNLTLNGGTLEAIANTVISTTRSIALGSGGGSLAANTGVSLDYAGTISGAGDLTKSGAGTLTLTGDNSYNGGTTISAGTLQIGNGGTSGSVNGNITNNGALVLNRSDSVTYSGIISGTGSGTKLGSGTLTLTGTNTYSGGTTISAGTLQIGDGGTSGSITGNITNSGALVFNRSDSLAYSDIISGSGSLSKSGAGTLTLSGANIYTGNTTISAGSLIIGSAGTAGAGALSIAIGSVFEYASSANQTISGAITGAGSLSKSGAGTLTLSGANTYSGGTTISAGTLTGTASNSFGTGAIANNGALVFDQNANASFTGVISGTGSLTKLGAGNLILSGTNTYGGVTRIDAGVLQIGSEAQLGTGTITMAGGTLQFVNSGAVSLTKPVTLVADSAIEFVASTAAGTGSIVSNGNSQTQELQVTWSGASVASEINGGFGLRIASDGNLAITGNLGTTQALARLSAKATGELRLGATAQIRTTGDISLSALTRFINQSTSASVLSSTGGSWRVYSENLDPFSPTTGDQTGALDHQFRAYNYQPTSAVNDLHSFVLSGHNGFVYKLAPSATLLPATAISKTYDGTTIADPAILNFSVSGGINGDVLTFSGIPSGVFATANASTTSVSIAGITVLAKDSTDKPVLGYGFTPSVAATITPKPLEGTLIGSVSRTYNGTSLATLSASNYSLSGLVGNESFTVNKTRGTFDNQNVGSGLLVTATLGPADYSAGAGTLLTNYVLPTTMSGTIGAITPKTITISLTGSVQKIYDGSLTTTLNSDNFQASGLIDGDVLLLKPITVIFVSKEVGQSISVTSSISNGDLISNNYSLSATTLTGTVGVITPKPLVGTLVGSVSRAYDGTSLATLSADNYSFSGLVGNESLTVNKTQGTFDNQNVGSGLPVTTTLGPADYLAGTGTLLTNYVLPSTMSGAIGAITPRPLSVTLTGEITRVYDGTTKAGLSPGNFNLSGLVAGETISVTQAQGQFASPNAGTGVTVTAELGNSNFAAVSGTSLANYSLPTIVSGAIGIITPRRLRLELIGSASKVYDGTTTIDLAQSNIKLNGLLADEVITVTTTAA